MRRTLYLVSGSTGEYSDRRDWPVLLLPAERAAEELVARLAAWCDERGVGENCDLDNVGAYERAKQIGSPPEDPRFQVDYTGTRYSYEAVDLEWCGHSECLERADMAADCARAREGGGS